MALGVKCYDLFQTVYRTSQKSFKKNPPTPSSSKYTAGGRPGCVHEWSHKVVCREVKDQAKGDGDGKSRQCFLKNSQ